jgi:hypothetical protein
METTETLRQQYRLLDLPNLLKQKPSALLDVPSTADQALSQIGIKSVFDLGSSWLFQNARAVAGLAVPGSPEARLGLLAADLLTAGMTAPSAGTAAGLGIENLQGLTPAQAQALKDALGVTTIDDLAFWPPQATARTLVAQAAGQTPQHAEPGEELRPRFGQYPTERIYYDTLVMLGMEGDDVAAVKDLSTDGPVPLNPTVTSPGFGKPALGARLTLAQSWYAQGITLGHLLHCLMLASGEATRVAVVDWTRRTSAFSAESIGETEQLDNAATHSRSLSEVQEAVAKEAQQGFSQSDAGGKATSHSEQGSAGTGLLTSLFASGDLSTVDNQATTSAQAQSSSWSTGDRDVSASLMQQVQDRTEQHAGSTRNRRASAVREVSQSEHDSVSTRIVANYNHMHALTVQYFEVVQVYRVDVKVHRIDRVLFIPLELLDFADANVIERFRGALGRSALTRRAFNLLVDASAVVQITPAALTVVSSTSPGIMKVASGPSLMDLAGSPNLGPGVAATGSTASNQSTMPVPGLGKTLPSAGTTPPAPTLPSGGTPLSVGSAYVWDDRAIIRATQLIGVPLVRPGSNALHLPADTEVTAITFDGVTVTKLRLTHQGGFTDLDAPAGSWVGLPQETILAGLTAIAISSPKSDPGSKSMTLQCRLRGVPFSLPPIPLVLPRGTDFQTVVQLETDAQARQDELKHHLMQNRLYYSQAAYRSLDSAAITSILAPFQYQGAPLVDQVDPTPVTVAANYLVLRAPTATSTSTSPPTTTSTPATPSMARLLSSSAPTGTPGAASVEPGTPAPNDQGAGTDLTSWGKLLALRGIQLGTGDSRLVSLPTGGVFAEAVLGQSNSAELLDITRFWNWQDSPIPIQPPEVAPVSTGSRASPEDLKPGQLGAPVLNISSPSTLPDPSGLAAILGAIANGNMFRDMSGLAGTQGLVTAGMQGTLQAADQAGQIASANMRTEAQKAIAMGQIAADLAKAFLGVPSTGGSVQGISGQGAKINQGQSMDRRGVSSGGNRTGSAGAGLNGQGGGTSGTGGGGRSNGVLGGTPKGGFETQAYESALAPGQSPSVSNLAGALADSLSSGMGEIQLASASGDGAIAGSTVNAALPLITAFETGAGTSPWMNLSRASVATRLRELVTNPDKVKQADLNLCGPAIFARLWAARDPAAFAQFAIELFEKGHSQIGQYKVRPRSASLLGEDYTQLVAKYSALPNPKEMPPPADWMILGSIRDVENSVFRYKGTPEEDVSAITPPGEVVKWLNAAGAWRKVRDETNLLFTKGLDHAQSLAPDGTTDVALLINSAMLPKQDIPFFMKVTPNHYIGLESKIRVFNDTVEFVYWTWGNPLALLSIPVATFQKHYYGALIAQRDSGLVITQT